MGYYMRLLHNYHIASEKFPHELCEKIIKTGESLDKMQGSTSDKKNDVRDSQVSWISQQESTQWLFDKITAVARQANHLAHWNFALTRFESLQYTCYDKSGFYTWHPDMGKKPLESGVNANLCRKLTFVLQLSKTGAFTGGDFQLECVTHSPEDVNSRINTITQLREYGAILIFPAWLWHRVTPITSGFRQSLVGWFNGPPFV
jgi:PKHD-type hydroxylase